MKYLVDTDWLIDVYIGRLGPARILDGLQPLGIGVSIISHGELFEGAYDFPDTERRLTRVRSLLLRLDTLPLSEPIMEVLGRTRSSLRRSGQLIPDLDLLIAATAVHHGVILLIRNVRHFARVPDLVLCGSQ